MRQTQARPQIFDTPVTQTYGTRIPVVAGGLQWLANADYVAAAGRAGSISFITAASFPDLDDLRAEIRRCRGLCDGAPFGVNVSMIPKLERENPEIGIGGLMEHVSGQIGRKAYETGDVSRGILSAGHALGFVDKVEPFAAIIERLETEALGALSNLGAVA